MTELTETFEPGTYQTRSICDSDCIFSYEITRVSPSSVWIKKDGKEVRRGICKGTFGHSVKPEGNYSMCPVIRPEDRVTDEVETVETEEDAPELCEICDSENHATGACVDPGGPVGVIAKRESNVIDFILDSCKPRLELGQVVNMVGSVFLVLFDKKPASRNQVKEVLTKQLEVLAMVYDFDELADGAIEVLTSTIYENINRR